ncbi:MAG: nucleotidyltransferase domain-containing protein [Leptolyngbyaceae cyanobacterium SM2_5_2]|nr:nucleotidyltransferase domain-containing protein [Leptolyngbyaceae cyanobacterium SM2_5_2]
MAFPSTDNLAAYIQTARQRQQRRRERQQLRRTRGLELAREAADLLKANFSISRVVLFGSVLDAAGFHEMSDVDLAVWDLGTKDYIAAVACLLELPDFSFDLVPVETASPYLRAAISQGIPL